MAISLGTPGNDPSLLADLNDLVLGLDGDDDLDAGLGAGGNVLGGGNGDDTLYAGQNDLLLGDPGNDELDATDGGSDNKLYGGAGNDQLYSGDNNQLWAGAGNDLIYLVGGSNQVWSGSGGDRLWLALAEIPTPPNIIEDFDPRQDQIGVLLTGVTGLNDLSFEAMGQNVEVKLASGGEVLALVKNTQPTDFNENTVVFDNNAPLNNLSPVNDPTEQNRKTVAEVELLGLTTFATGSTFQETQVGGLSGIIFDPSQQLYYAISDDRSQLNPARFYGLTIDLADGSLDDGDVVFTSVTTLRDAQGTTFAVNSLDPEAIAITENGSVYIASEGSATALINPFVNEFSLSGQQLSQLPVDAKFFPTADQSSGIRNNLAFESLTITPNGRYLYTATENALAQDGSATTLENNSFSRIIKYDLTTGQAVGELVYEVEPIPQDSNPPGGFADNGLVELLALDNNGTLLALERSFAAGVGNTVKLYQVQTQGALNVQGFDNLFREDELEDDGEIIGPDRFEIDPPVSKRLLVDFADLGITPDNLEGISLGPVLPDGRQSLIVVSDNNFSDTQTTQFIALGLDIATLPAALPTVETPYTIDDEDGDTPLIGDSDDPAVWIDPNNSGNSIVIGTLKDGGLAVFNLAGEILQTVTPADILGAGAEYGDLRYNNVDVLYYFPLGDGTVDIAVTSDRQNDTLNVFQVDPSTRQLINVTSEELLNGDFSIFGVDDGEATAYGLAGYRSPITGQYYVFVTQASGNKIAQLELQATDAGTITATLVRTIELPIAEGNEAEDYQSEAIAVDQEQGVVYLAVEGEIGIVKFAAEPDGSNQISVVRPVDSPELVPDLEGLAIYYGPNGTGYLVASSQGDSSYAVYTREGNNDYLGSFVVGDNTALGIDQANETDGLDIINVPLGPNFPFGAFLVQDGANDPQNPVENDEELENNATNFKFVPWENVANAFTTPLTIDTTSYDPRGDMPELNQAPTVLNPLADQMATQDQPFAFTVPGNTFIDVDGDELFYSAFLEDGTTPLPSWLSFNEQTLQFSGTPGNSDVGSVNVGVFANDGFLTAFDVFTLEVENVNDAPTSLGLSPSSVDENVPPNTAIGIFFTTDPDVGDTFSYSLIAGTGATDNGAFTIVNNQLRINNSPDFETKNSYSIRAQTTDQGGLSFTEVFTISINDLDEGPEPPANEIGVSTENGLFFVVLSDGTRITLKYQGEPIIQGTFGNWQLIEAETINGQNQALWQNPDTGEIGLWDADANWNWISSETWPTNSFNTLEAEFTFQVDINGDELLGDRLTLIENQGSISFLEGIFGNYYVQTADDLTTPIKFGGEAFDNIFGNWQGLAAETVGSVNQVLFENQTTNEVGVWNTDATWNWLSSNVFAAGSPEALAQSAIFGVDISVNTVA